MWAKKERCRDRQPGRRRGFEGLGVDERREAVGQAVLVEASYMARCVEVAGSPAFTQAGGRSRSAVSPRTPWPHWRHHHRASGGEFGGVRQDGQQIGAAAQASRPPRCHSRKKPMYRPLCIRSRPHVLDPAGDTLDQNQRSEIRFRRLCRVAEPAHPCPRPVDAIPARRAKSIRQTDSVIVPRHTRRRQGYYRRKANASASFHDGKMEIPRSAASDSAGVAECRFSPSYPDCRGPRAACLSEQIVPALCLYRPRRARHRLSDTGFEVWIFPSRRGRCQDCRRHRSR